MRPNGSGKALRQSLILQYEQYLRGNNLFPWALKGIAEKVALSYIGEGALREIAKQKKLRFSDFLIDLYSEKIKNTRIARKLNKYTMIKPYGEDVEWIRILKS